MKIGPKQPSSRPGDVDGPAPANETAAPRESVAGRSEPSADNFAAATRSTASSRSSEEVFSDLMRTRSRRSEARDSASGTAGIAAAAAGAAAGVPDVSITSVDPALFMYKVQEKVLFTLGSSADDLALAGGRIGLNVDGQNIGVDTTFGQSAEIALRALEAQIRAAGFELDKRVFQTNQPGQGIVRIEEWTIKYPTGTDPTPTDPTPTDPTPTDPTPTDPTPTDPTPTDPTPTDPTPTDPTPTDPTPTDPTPKDPPPDDPPPPPVSTD